MATRQGNTRPLSSASTPSFDTVNGLIDATVRTRTRFISFSSSALVYSLNSLTSHGQGGFCHLMHHSPEVNPLPVLCWAWYHGVGLLVLYEGVASKLVCYKTCATRQPVTILNPLRSLQISSANQIHSTACFSTYDADLIASLARYGRSSCPFDICPCSTITLCPRRKQNFTMFVESVRKERNDQGTARIRCRSIVRLPSLNHAKITGPRRNILNREAL